MPSSQLSLLSQQIENQPTDHFGKFYMYVSLLNSVSEQKKTFTQGLPKYKGHKTLEMNLGPVPEDFQEQVKAYVDKFTKQKSHWSGSLYNIVMAYMRKGTISDLVYIIDKMLHHLSVMEGPQSHNQDLYNELDFANKKESIAQYVRQLAAFNHQLLLVADKGGNAALASVVAVAGIIIILASMFTLIPSLIGLGLIVGGVAAACHFAIPAVQQGNALENTMKDVSQQAVNLSKDRNLFNFHNRNQLAFFSSALLPLPYAAITAAEQIPIGDSARKLKEARTSLNGMSELIGMVI